MCGIAGLVDLSGQDRPAPQGILGKMASAIIHRGPDEDGYFEQPGIGLANRRLSIVGLGDGRQPIRNEDGSVVAVFNGEFFDYPEKKAQLQGRGHRFRTHTDTEIIPHLWEDYQEGMFDHLRGQFAVACLDLRRRTFVLGRDHFGICPLFWTIQSSPEGDWLLFASEIKAILASGMVTARPDLRGLNHIFHFFAMPGPITCFEGIQLLLPGQYLKFDLPPGKPATRQSRRYWQIDFPDAGHERDGDAKTLVDEFEQVMLASVDRRLRADVPVVSYLSGGIDSSVVVALACHIRKQPIQTFTIKILDPKLDETSQAAVVSKHIGVEPIVVPVGDEEITHTYAELTRAAEAPVIDTSCTALLLLARAVHQNGYKVALTGEGSDEWLTGYGWYKVNRLLRMTGPLQMQARDLIARLMKAPTQVSPYLRHTRDTLGHYSAFQEIYSLMDIARFRFFAPETLEALKNDNPYLNLDLNLDRMNRWHHINQGLFFAARIHLAGHLLSLKGDRVAMNSSVEARYPFLDMEVFKFLASIHPRWKLRGFKDKYILRLLGERYLPHEAAWRPKGMFRAPLDSFFGHGMPSYVNQLVSPESLKKTGYFNAQAVAAWLDHLRNNRISRIARPAVELGLSGVFATQLWHHLYIDGSLADLPSGWQRPATPATRTLAATA